MIAQRQQQATTGNNTTDVTVDTIKAAFDAAQKLLANRPALPDAFLMTDEMREEFKRQYETEQHHFRPCFDKFFGLAFEHYPTMSEVLARARELAAAGRKVVVATTVNPNDVPSV